MDSNARPTMSISPSFARSNGAGHAASKRLPDEESWTAVERQELDHATSYVSESMYLVMANPVSVLFAGESVRFKAHAQCDRSAKKIAGVAPTPGAEDALKTIYGTLFLTEYRVLFLSFHGREQQEDPDKEQGKDQQQIVQVFVQNIAEIFESRVMGTDGATLSQIEISCKNFEVLKFNFPNELMSGELYVRLTKILGSSYPELASVIADPSKIPDENGWGLYDLHDEFARLGFRTPSVEYPLRGFRVTKLNSAYKLCPTYPGKFIVPASLSDNDLCKISCFRARGRLPAVTYRHKNNAVLARCGQPLTGIRRKRSAADEAYVAAITRETETNVVFIDCRSQTSAYGNIALGGGFEIVDYYRDSAILFMGIENIHSMRDSIRKLFDMIKYEVRGNERSNWWSCLEATRWLEHVRSILVACATCVTKIADEKTSLIVHCSDGWDRTSQIVALTKLCLDPFYRTTKGFAVLIEEEWCAFGHQFRARSGRPSDRAGGYWEDDNASPVFVQFIDAVWQLTRQFPCSFEFTERFLVALVDEVYTRRSGTFLFDCEEARMTAKAPSRSISVWTLLTAQEHAGDFVNPFYVMNCQDGITTERGPSVLQYKWHTSSLAIWSSFYLRSLESNDSRETWAKELQVNQRELQAQLSTAHQRLQSQVDANTEMQSQLELLRRERAELRHALEGQVFNDAARGVCIHEEESDDDAVLLSVTHVRSVDEVSAPIPIPVANRPHSTGSLTPPSHGGSNPSSFIGASISPSFEIMQSYFDLRSQVSNPSSSKIHSMPRSTDSQTTKPTTTSFTSRSTRSSSSTASDARTSHPSSRICTDDLVVSLSAQILDDSVVR